VLSGAILILAFASSAAVSVVGRFHARARDWLAVVASLELVGLVACAHGREEEVIYIADFLGTELVLSMTALGWFFAICIVLINAASVVFSLSYMKGKENLTFYYAMMLLVNAGMLGIVLSGDFLSFYIFWEVMSWSTFLLISYRGFLLYVLVTFGIAFGVKAAMVPLHTWLPDAHSEAPSPFSAMLSGVLIKMGIYGFVFVMYSMVGLKLLLGLGWGWLNFHYLLCWLGALTIVIPTFIAVLQNDAKRLLAWSSIGQIG